MLKINAYYTSLEPGDLTHYKFYIIPLTETTVAISGSLLGYRELNIQQCKETVHACPSLLKYEGYNTNSVNLALVDVLNIRDPKVNPWTQLAAIVAVYKWSQEK